MPGRFHAGPTEWTHSGFRKDLLVPECSSYSIRNGEAPFLLLVPGRVNLGRPT